MGKKRILTIGIVFLLLTTYSSAVVACVGARPMGMGGAYIAVADDAHSIYWNPAGFGRVESRELTYTGLLATKDVRDSVPYDHFGALAYPLGPGTFGVGFIFNQRKSPELELDDRWFTMGYGLSLEETIGQPVFVGANIRHVYFEAKTYDPRESDSDRIWEFDFGFLWELTPALTLGVLGQNFTETRVSLLGEKEKRVFNLRPGIAWKAADNLTLAMDMYDALNNAKAYGIGQELNVGMEVRATDEIQLRAGGYIITNEIARAYTAGIGYRHRSGLSLEYTLMHLELASEQVHYVSAGYRF